MKYLLIVFLFMMSSTSQATTIYQPIVQQLDSSKVHNNLVKTLKKTSVISSIIGVVSGVAGKYLP